MNQLICASLSHTHYWYEVGMLKVPAYAELNIYLCNSTTFSLSVADNNQADAGQGDQARLVRLNFQARRGIGKNSCFPFQLTTNRITDIHTYVYTPDASTRTPRHVYSVCVVPAYLKFTYRTNMDTNRCIAVAVQERLWTLTCDAGPPRFCCFVWIDRLLTKVSSADECCDFILRAL